MSMTYRDEILDDLRGEVTTMKGGSVRFLHRGVGDPPRGKPGDEPEPLLDIDLPGPGPRRWRRRGTGVRGRTPVVKT